MSAEYPDILGDLLDARQRFEVNGVHYMLALEPDIISPGETTNLRIWLQSCWDMPIQAAITVHLPTSPSPTLSVLQKHTDVPLEPAEVGEVTIPIASSPNLGSEDHRVHVAIGAHYETRGLYIRSQKNEGHLGDPPLTFKTGMGLAATMGLGYAARTQPEQSLTLKVNGAPLPAASGDLTPTYLSHWTVSELQTQGKARQYVNDQRLHMIPSLTRQALYLAFLEESRARFQDASLPLQIGEALFVAKILTFTAEFFLKRAEWQDVILLPTYNLAYRYNLATDDPIFLIARADYARMTRLACSLSFDLLRRRLNRDVWTMAEQMAVANLISERVERGGVLAAEFLYLPLLLGGLLVASDVTMPGEKASQSIGMLAKARVQRASSLSENQDLVLVLDRLLRETQ